MLSCDRKALYDQRGGQANLPLFAIKFFYPLGEYAHRKVM